MVAKALEIHPAALSELKSALAWYLARNETAAFEFVAEVERAVGLIVESPPRWPSGEHGTRKFVLSRFPFAIVYREKETAVQILAIAHGHKNPEYWKTRL
jgi:plasmid stabilization system protein ParE